MSARIGINGFGRMGRLGLRAGWDIPELQFVRINEIAADASCSAHLLQFDSVHGSWAHDCRGDDDWLSIDRQVLAYTTHDVIAGTDWSDCDIVIEATGNPLAAASISVSPNGSVTATLTKTPRERAASR